MSAVIGGSKTDGIFADEAELILQTIPNGRRVELITGERYYTSAFNDTGEALTLAGGNYANLIESGGGGGLPINAMLEINSTDDLYIATDSTEWLKSGVIETDVASYPDAKKEFSVTSVSYAGVNFSALSSTQSICWDGTHFWVVGGNSDAVYQYTAAGGQTGVFFSVQTQDISPTGVCWDGTHFWVVGTTSDRAYQYTAAGVYTGVSFSVVDQDTEPTGICWDGTHFWVVGYASDKAYQYTVAGVYTGVNFSVADQDGVPRDITWDGTHFWVIGTTDDEAYQYTAAGVYTGVSFSVTGQDVLPSGICWDGTHFWAVGQNTDRAYKYEVEGFEYTGVSVQSNGAAGLPNYTRIK